MREVFVNQDYTRVGFYKSVLEDAGIANFVRNELANNITEMPSPLFFPALCVVHDEDYDEAMRILGGIYYEQPSQAADWRCPACSEEVPGNFASCWQCGTLRADQETNSDQPGNV
jgi:hypothetical protein